MAPLRCGCEELRAAEKIKEPEARTQASAVAREEALRWGCPRVCGAVPTQPTADAAESLREIEVTTGTTGLRTCPNWYASLPWAHVAARARKWREYGELAAVASPTSAVVFAIDEIDAGKAARDADDDEKREQRRKQRDG